ncbi:MAG: acyl carrier protein [Planctomycetota bacterium]
MTLNAFEKVRAIMVEIFQVSENKIPPDLEQEDLENWDSLQHLNLMLALEQEFEVTLDVDDLATLTSVPAILKYLE